MNHTINVTRKKHYSLLRILYGMEDDDAVIRTSKNNPAVIIKITKLFFAKFRNDQGS
jgi:hypothetical protein